MLHCDKHEFGRASRLEKEISGFKFQGPGIYDYPDQTILVIPFRTFNKSPEPDICPAFSPTITTKEIEEIWNVRFGTRNVPYVGTFI